MAWDEPHRYALTYPCSGALANHGGRETTPGTLAALLGPARAAILMLLATPLTTTQLVAITGQGLGSVGRHLGILRDAGLLERHRVGRSVLYRRSPAGNLLVRLQDEAGSTFAGLASSPDMPPGGRSGEPGRNTGGVR